MVNLRTKQEVLGLVDQLPAAAVEQILKVIDSDLDRQARLREVQEKPDPINCQPATRCGVN